MVTPHNTTARDGKTTQTEEDGASEVVVQPEELKNLNYELLLVGLSLLSVLNLILLIWTRDPEILNILSLIDVPMTVIFFFDFITRFFSAKSKKKYFFRQFGWADLLASLPLPAFKILRLFRIFRAWRLISRYGAQSLRRQLNEHRAEAALAVIAFLIMYILEFGAIFVTVAERTNPAANIKTGADALWWAFVTIATVGYGDRFPITGWGRLVGMLVMMTGVGLFGVLTAYLANAFLTPRQKKDNRLETEPTPEQITSQAMLVEIMRLMSEREKEQEELRAMLAELKNGTQQLATGHQPAKRDSGSAVR